MTLVLFHCLNELNDHSLITEIQSYLTSGKINGDILSPHQWSALVYILMTSNERLNEFELRKYGRSDSALFWLLPVIKLSKKIWWEHLVAYLYEVNDMKLNIKKICFYLQLLELAKYYYNYFYCIYTKEHLSLFALSVNKMKFPNAGSGGA